MIKDTIIIIKPESDKAKELINDPIEIVTAIEQSKYGKLKIDDIRTNKRKGLLVAYVKQQTPAIIEELVKVKKIGKWNVQCYLPNRERFKAGVISPVSTTADIEKVKLILSNKYRIQMVERLKKKIDNSWVPSTSLKIVFDEEKLPEKIVIGHSLYNVRPYISQPLQCFRCQRLGHTAQGCNARIRCLVCGEDHLKEVCSAREEKCANCGGRHKANSKYCIMIKQAYESQRVMVQRSRNTMGVGVTLNRRESLTSLPLSNLEPRQYRILTTQADEQQGMIQSIDGTPTYSEKVRANLVHLKTVGYNNSRYEAIPGTTKEVGTQTDKAQSSGESKFSCEEFLTKLRGLFVSIKTGASTEAEKVIDEAMSRNFDNQNRNCNDGEQIPANKYNMRQRTQETKQQRNREDGEVVEVDSLEEGVLSSSDGVSDSESLFEAVEKKQV